MKTAYRVIADWGASGEDGDYCTYVWADSPEEAQRVCFAEMNNDDGVGFEYNVTYCETLDEFIRQSEAEIELARTFLANVVVVPS